MKKLRSCYELLNKKVVKMTEMSFINITVGILKEELKDIPNEYLIRIEDNSNIKRDATDFEICGELMEFIIKME